MGKLICKASLNRLTNHSWPRPKFNMASRNRKRFYFWYGSRVFEHYFMTYTFVSYLSTHCVEWNNVPHSIKAWQVYRAVRRPVLALAWRSWKSRLYHSLSWYTFVTLVYTTPDYGITYTHITVDYYVSGGTKVNGTIPLLSEINMHSHFNMATQTGSSYMSGSVVTNKFPTPIPCFHGTTRSMTSMPTVF